MLRSALRASAATLGLAIFVDVPSKNQPHGLKLKRADAAGATYRGVVSFEAIYVTPQSITPKLRLDQVQKLSDGVATGFAFVDEPVVVA